MKSIEILFYSTGRNKLSTVKLLKVTLSVSLYKAKTILDAAMIEPQKIDIPAVLNHKAIAEFIEELRDLGNEVVVG